MNTTPSPPRLGASGAVRRRGLIILVSAVLVVGVGLVLLRPLGLIVPLSVPTGAMTPAVAARDREASCDGVEFEA